MKMLDRADKKRTGFGQLDICYESLTQRHQDTKGGEIRFSSARVVTDSDHRELLPLHLSMYHENARQSGQKADRIRTSCGRQGKEGSVGIRWITPGVVKQALQSWRRSGTAPDELLELHWVLEQAPGSLAERNLGFREVMRRLVWETWQELREKESLSRLSSEQAETRQALLAALRDDFAVGNERLEAWGVLYLQYFSSASLSQKQLAMELSVAPRTLRRRIALGIGLLTEILCRREFAARRTEDFLTRHVPKADYVTLVGVQEQLQYVVDSLQEDGVLFVSLEGLGGIGKTALAHAVVHTLAQMQKVQDIAWVSAQQERLVGFGQLQPVRNAVRSPDGVITQLAQQLGQPQVTGMSTEEKLERLRKILPYTPYLVVVDNLETMEEVTALVPMLAPLAGKTRFLLTSRWGLEPYAYVRRVRLRPLSLDDSYRLLRDELKRHRHAPLPTRAQMEQLYAVVGGLPLALKLVAAQMTVIPLEQVIAGLAQATLHTSRSLYHYIYRRTWELLSDSGRRVLMAMTLVSVQGERASWIAKMSMLSPSRFYEGVLELHRYSLLELAGYDEEPRYRLHRLTQTFLLTDLFHSLEAKDDGWNAMA